ncbi:MAG TPA: [FeFe] hydrogenase H-cluster radical SAM maturase HydE [Candidatus Omnitrophota bacterium]|nr:[FeFe] hydrogenase H-cluster radical SAM maturase HydE [Candidatus Omnitrophota bacterium]HPS37040.1 [FeFe] hydrogenase H-cluster radical SAM maturase HydE [Candidatus Omnitrophota bacterium]
MNRKEILHWLREEDPSVLEDLWQRADGVRREHVGDEVHLRGLIEFSNYCARLCGYCGLRAANQKLERYRMTKEEILACARQAVTFGYGTVVLQSGEDMGTKREWMAEIIRTIKKETPLAVTLSLGERDDDDLVAWREAGADRYLLRFETSNPKLYEKIHPSLPGKLSDRLAILRKLKSLGYEAGSGVMIGIPGETYEDLVNDLELFHELDLDMIGVGPFIPHPGTPLGSEEPGEGQVPNSEFMTYKVIALTRIVCPEANIPSTTALATLNLARGRELGLSRGANIVMPNLTPVQYRAQYEIYPAKACIRETAAECHGCLTRRIESIGRKTGRGQGGRRRA